VFCVESFIRKSQEMEITIIQKSDSDDNDDNDDNMPVTQ
jgi:hypothetical protein